MNDYKITQSLYIVEHQQVFINQCLEIQTLLSSIDPTEAYRTYNLFSITAGSVHFYNLFIELNKFIRTEFPTGPLWMTAWVNIHEQENVLDWHDHYYPYHGFISIDAKNTETQFDNYSIVNKTGQIYMGPGDRRHRVKVNSPFDDKRITIGFDVTADPTIQVVNLEDQYIDATSCLGLIPLF